MIRETVSSWGGCTKRVSKWLFSFNFPVFLIVVLFPNADPFGVRQELCGGSDRAGNTVVGKFGGCFHRDVRAILDMTGYTRLKLMNAIARLVTVVALASY